MMSHSKGGSENVCVNYDTSTGMALGSLDVLQHRRIGADTAASVNCFKVSHLSSFEC